MYFHAVAVFPFLEHQLVFFWGDLSIKMYLYMNALCCSFLVVFFRGVLQNSIFNKKK